jgi:hypothetical protein
MCKEMPKRQYYVCLDERRENAFPAGNILFPIPADGFNTDFHNTTTSGCSLNFSFTAAATGDRHFLSRDEDLPQYLFSTT